MDFSIITIVNNQKIFDNFKENLKSQNSVNYELIVVDNKNGQFDSARKALNFAARKANGKYLFFMHPDIRFLDSNSLLDIWKHTVAIKNFGVLGIAGCPVQKVYDRNYILTNIVQGINKEHVGKSINSIVEAQTVDECFFIQEKDYFLRDPFSNEKGWHLYAVEQCLKSIIDGKKNYIIPARVWHLSPGNSEDINYVKSGLDIVDKYGDYFEFFNTTVERWYTKGGRRKYLPWMYFLSHKIKRRIKSCSVLYETVLKIYKKMNKY